MFSIGAGHFPHAVNRNMDITVVMMDNQTYGLTKGQTSPTSPVGHKTKSTPHGSIAQPMNPVLLALSMGATFVARAYSAKPNQLANLIVEGVRHKGFSFIQVESPCTEFNNTFNYFDSLVTELPEDWDTSDLNAAMSLALNEDKVHVGLFYKGDRPTWHEQFGNFVPDKREFDTAAYLKQFA
jgi:2-oxoglutarate ferredoxin oxidoreductase subunit beta